MIFLISVIISIIIHELGHLVAAKLCGCGVTTFSIGFGKPIVKFNWKKTTYQIAPILLGGYCELQHELKYSRSKYAFTNKTYSQKVFISLAGILMNIITAIIGVGLYLLTYNIAFLYFAIYSIFIGVSNLLPIPALDGCFWIAFLFEKKIGKKKLYPILSSIFSKWLRWLMILNVAFLPYCLYLIYTGDIL